MADADEEANTDDIEASIVEYFYERQVSGHKCGYCGSKDTFMTNGMWGHRLAGQDYQDLINRGWRRSGKYLYKPVMNRTCCPLYAIRCEALKFKPSRSQRRVAKRMRAFLVDGKQRILKPAVQEPNEGSKTDGDSLEEDKKDTSEPKEQTSEPKEEEPIKEVENETENEGENKQGESSTAEIAPSQVEKITDSMDVSDTTTTTAESREEVTSSQIEHTDSMDVTKSNETATAESQNEVTSSEVENVIPDPVDATKSNKTATPEEEVTSSQVESVVADVSKPNATESKEEAPVPDVEISRRAKKTPRPGAGADPDKPRCRKVREIRAERRRQKRVAAAGGHTAETKAEAKATENNKSEEDGEKPGTHQMEMDDSAAPVDKEKEPSPNQMETQPTEPEVRMEELLKIPTGRSPAHTLETKMVQCYPPTQEFISTFIESYMLYKKYQVAIHGDKEEELSERSFRRFLCDTPLISLDGPVGWESKYGSFHHQYYLDGKLVMVAVVDILPTYLSSVYVYYDPEYQWLGLGVYSALREIELVQKLNRSKPEFRYYCMGYYVHDNPKMNYKGNYSPSYLLCPDTNRYAPLSEARERLDKAKYSRLNDDPYEAERVLSFLGGVLILFEKQVIPYMLFRSYYGHVKDRIVIEYASLVGKAVTQRMFLYLTLEGSQQDEGSQHDEDSDD